MLEFTTCDVELHRQMGLTNTWGYITVDGAEIASIFTEL